MNITEPLHFIILGLILGKYKIMLFCSSQLETKDGTLLIDYSKNIVTKETMTLLFNLVS